MYAQEETRNTAIIYNFPVRARIASNRIAEQIRQMKEIESARSMPVVDTAGWYHEAAIAEQKRH